MQDILGTLEVFVLARNRTGALHSLPSLERKGFGAISRLPICIRVLLESVLRNVDGKRVTEQDVRNLAGWRPHGERTAEVPFIVSRVLLQDFTGVPRLVDLAALRSAVARTGGDGAELDAPHERTLQSEQLVEYRGDAHRVLRGFGSSQTTKYHGFSVRFFLPLMAPIMRRSSRSVRLTTH